MLLCAKVRKISQTTILFVNFFRNFICLFGNNVKKRDVRIAFIEWGSSFGDKMSFQTKNGFVVPTKRIFKRK
jgi:hypothetical protein